MSSMRPTADALQDASVANLGSGSLQILPVDVNRKYLMIHNQSAVSQGVNPTGASALVGRAGTVTLVSNGSLTYEGTWVPTNAFQAQGTSGAGGLTIIVGTTQ